MTDHRPVELDQETDNPDEQSNWTGLALVLGLLVILGFASPASLVIVLAIVVFVFLHELGHFMTAQ